MDNEPKHGVEYRIHLTKYAAGDDGTIWSYRKGKWKQMEILVAMQFWVGPVRHQMQPAQFILEAFGVPRPNGPRMRIFYKDGDKTNLSLKNISWKVKQRVNYRNSDGVVLQPKDVKEIRRRHEAGEHIESIRMDYRVTKQQIKYVISGERWSKVRRDQ